MKIVEAHCHRNTHQFGLGFCWSWRHWSDGDPLRQAGFVSVSVGPYWLWLRYK